jgi:hypothetical protein
MMRSIFIIFFSIVLNHGFAQESVNDKSIKIQNTGYFISKTLRFISAPQYVVKIKNHSFSVGPTILMFTRNCVSDHQLPKLNGLQASYNLYPLLDNKNINFHIFNDLIVQRTNDKWTSTIWDNTQLLYIPYKYQNTEFAIFNHFGYGIDVLFGNRFSLNQSVGLGLYYSSTSGKAISENAPNIPFENKNANGYSSLGFSWQIQFGLEYKL